MSILKCHKSRFDFESHEKRRGPDKCLIDVINKKIKREIDIQKRRRRRSVLYMSMINYTSNIISTDILNFSFLHLTLAHSANAILTLIVT